MHIYMHTFYFALTVEILRLDFTTILHFDFGILQFKCVPSYEICFYVCSCREIVPKFY